MATQAMKPLISINFPQHQPLISSNFPLLESGKYRMSGIYYRKVVESMSVSSLLINDQSLVSESKPVSEVLRNQISSTSNLDGESLSKPVLKNPISISNLAGKKAENVQEPNKIIKVYSRIRRQSKEEQDSSFKQPCKLADTVKVSPQLEICLLENQSTSITLGETETKVVYEQETRSNMTISIPAENKDGDHNLDVSKNEAAHDDIVVASSSKEEKEKQVEKDLVSSKPWTLRPPKSSSHVWSDKTNGDLKIEGNVEKKEIKRKLTISLTRQEIEEDFFLMTGSKPPRKKQKKSNKRSRELKKTLDSLFPGLRFHGMSADSYKVPKR